MARLPPESDLSRGVAPSAAALDRARGIELLILDVDGVLTDGRLYYGASGEELKAFHTQDGSAVKRLMAAGVAVAIITGRNSPAVARRAAELGIAHLYVDAEEKTRALAELGEATGIDAARMAHAGDDLPDLPLFERVGMSFAVPNAHPTVAAQAHYVTVAGGGFGAVREICDLILTAQGRWLGER